MIAGRSLCERLIDNRVTRRVRPQLDRSLFRSRAGVRLFERLANRLSPERRAALFRQSAGSAGRGCRFGASEWHVADGPSSYVLPLRADHAAFDWAAALGALGHDAGVKAEYRRLTRSARAQRQAIRFIDVGANFGWHSFWHLGAGHTVLALEPNPKCHSYFRYVCRLNGWRDDCLMPSAAGDAPGEAELCYPDGQEWLGTLRPERITHADPSTWNRIRVPIVALDSMDLDEGSAWLVLKIDTEGHELAVLSGALRLLTRCRAVFFESWHSDPDRLRIFERLQEAGFSIFDVVDRGRGRTPLGSTGFVDSHETNFLALRTYQS